MILVIGLAGRIGCGKGTAAKYLAKKYGAQRFVYSEILSDILERLHLPVTRTNLQRLGKTVREAFGKDVLVEAMKGDLEDAKAEMRLIDGVRYVNEVEMLRTFPHNRLIFIDVPLEMRHERVRKRGERGEKEMPLEEFRKKDRAATEKELGQVRELADYVVDNSGTIEELHQRIDALMRRK